MGVMRGLGYLECMAIAHGTFKYRSKNPRVAYQSDCGNIGNKLSRSTSKMMIVSS